MLYPLSYSRVRDGLAHGAGCSTSPLALGGANLGNLFTGAKVTLESRFG